MFVNAGCSFVIGTFGIIKLSSYVFTGHSSSEIMQLIKVILKDGKLGWVTESTEESEKFSKYVKVCPARAGPVEDIAIVKVLSPFFVITENPAAGSEAPIDFNVP